MNVRIERRVTGVLDGIGLSSLVPGLTYSLPLSVARYLIQQRAAIQVALDAPVSVISFGAAAVDRIAGGIVVSQTNPPVIAIADDRPRRRRKRKPVA